MTSQVINKKIQELNLYKEFLLKLKEKIILSEMKDVEQEANIEMGSAKVMKRKNKRNK